MSDNVSPCWSNGNVPILLSIFLISTLVQCCKWGLCHAHPFVWLVWHVPLFKALYLNTVTRISGIRLSRKSCPPPVHPALCHAPFFHLLREKTSLLRSSRWFFTLGWKCAVVCTTVPWAMRTRRGCWRSMAKTGVSSWETVRASGEPCASAWGKTQFRVEIHGFDSSEGSNTIYLLNK